MGVKVKNLTDAEKERYGTEVGVKIVGVPETYRRYDLEGKIILAVDDDEIRDIEDARNLFAKISRYGNTSITLLDENGQKERIIFQ